MDHVSDSFIEGSIPLMMLVEVANLASANEDGVKMVRYAAHQTQNLCPQVINAAWVLVSRPRSKVAQVNMDAQMFGEDSKHSQKFWLHVDVMMAFVDLGSDVMFLLEVVLVRRGGGPYH